MMTQYGIDWGKGPSKTVIMVIGMRCGKTFYSRLWLQYHSADLISKRLIRKLAAEGVINISINS